MTRTASYPALTLLLCLVAVACGDDDSTTTAGGDVGGTILAGLEADSIVRLVTVDNSFGPEADPFDTVNIGTLIGGSADQPLQPRAPDLIDTALEASADIVFVHDVEVLIDELFDENTIGTAVASIEDLRISGDRAELDMRLRCGVLLNYEAELTDTCWGHHRDNRPHRHVMTTSRTQLLRGR